MIKGLGKRTKWIILFIMVTLVVEIVCFPVLNLNSVWAADAVMKYIKVKSNDQITIYKCVWDGNNAYCSLEDLASISTYELVDMEDSNDFYFERKYYGNQKSGTGELQTEVKITFPKMRKKAKVEVMGNQYLFKYYKNGEKIYLPLEAMLYLLHTDWSIEGDTVFVVPMPLTILDFMSVYNQEVVELASTSEDVLLDTGWIGCENKYMQTIYSSVADFFNDFDGKVFYAWIPGKGNIKLQESYEKAILQLARNDKEFISDDMQEDAAKKMVDSVFALNNQYYSKLSNLVNMPGNVIGVVNSVPDALDIIGKLRKKPERYKTLASKMPIFDEDSLDPELFGNNEYLKKAEEIGTGIDILQAVWNVYETVAQVEEWDDRFLSELKVLKDYENPGWVNQTVINATNRSAKKLLKIYEAPEQATLETIVENALAIAGKTIFDKSPFGQAFAIAETAGNCIGIFNQDFSATYDVYEELSYVTNSVKVEQLLQELLKYNNLLYTEETLTQKSIEEFRNQMTLYIRLNYRNKAQLYQLNIKGNKNKDWKNTEEGKDLYNEILSSYTMMMELIDTKNADSLLLLSNKLEIKEEQKLTQQVVLDEEDLNKEYDIFREYLEEHEKNVTYFQIVNAGAFGEPVLLTADKIFDCFQYNSSCKYASSANLFYIEGNQVKPAVESELFTNGTGYGISYVKNHIFIPYYHTIGHYFAVDDGHSVGEGAELLYDDGGTYYHYNYYDGKAYGIKEISEEKFTEYEKIWGVEPEQHIHVNFVLNTESNRKQYCKRTQSEQTVNQDQIKIYKAYMQKIEEYESRYGKGRIVDDMNGVSYMKGVAFIHLTDFNNDGLYELLLAYNKTEEADLWSSEYKCDVWEYRDGNMIMLDSVEAFQTDGATPHIYLAYHENKSYLVTGKTDSLGNYYYHGYSDGEFGVKRTVIWENDGEDGIINGEGTSYDKIQEEQNQWLQDVEDYTLAYDCDKTYTKMQKNIDWIEKMAHS